MKMLTSKILILFCFVTTLLRSEIQLVGFTSFGDENLYSLRNTETRDASGWLKIGREFSGYTLANYDEKSAILTLKKGSETIQLRMAESKIIAASPSDGLEAKRTAIIASAKREVLRREGWETPTVSIAMGQPEGDGDEKEWNVVVRNSTAPRDARLIVIAHDGRVKEYLTPSAGKERPLVTIPQK